MGVPAPSPPPPEPEQAEIAAPRPAAAGHDAALHSLSSLLLARAAARGDDAARQAQLRARDRAASRALASLVLHEPPLRLPAPPAAWRPPPLDAMLDAVQTPSSPPPLAPPSDSDYEEDEWGDLPELVADVPSPRGGGPLDDLCPFADGLDQALTLGALPPQGLPRASFRPASFTAGLAEAAPPSALRPPRFLRGNAGGGSSGSTAAAAPASSAGAAAPQLEAELSSLACKLVALRRAHAAQLEGVHPQIQADLAAVANQLSAIAGALAAGPPPLA